MQALTEAQEVAWRDAQETADTVEKVRGGSVLAFHGPAAELVFAKLTEARFDVEYAGGYYVIVRMPPTTPLPRSF